MSPRVSILMPVFNGEEFLPDALRSVLAQSFRDFEFIIVAEHGTSALSLEIIESFPDPRIRLLRNTSRLGIAGSLNAGMDACGGEYVVRMDADDISVSTRVDVQVRFMDSHPEVGVSGAWMKFFGDAKHVNTARCAPAQVRTMLLFQCELMHPTVIMRKRLFDEHALRYDSRYTAAEDFELWTRAVRCFDAANVPEVLLYYRWHRGNASQTKYRSMVRQHLGVVERQLQTQLGLSPDAEQLESLLWEPPSGLRSIRQFEKVSRWYGELQSSIAGRSGYDTSCLREYLARKWTRLVLRNIGGIGLAARARVCWLLPASRHVSRRDAILLALSLVTGDPAIAKRIRSFPRAAARFARGKLRGALRRLSQATFAAREAAFNLARSLRTTGNRRVISFLVARDTGQSYRYRVANVIDCLERFPVRTNVVFDDETHKWSYVQRASDLVIVFRVAYSEEINRLLEAIRENGIPLVFDMDDLVFEPDLAPYWGDAVTADAALMQRIRRRALALQLVLKKCDYATAPTPSLAARLGAYVRRSDVVRNTLNRRQLRAAQRLAPRQDGDVVRIGFFSGSRTHQRDFLCAASALCRLLEDHRNVELTIVGYLELGAEFERFADRIVRHPFVDYRKQLALLSHVDINIAPLETENPFNDSKSELKIFEAALVRVPSVVSAVDSYRRCVSHGVNGYLAESPEDWYRCLSALVDDRALRKRIGDAAYGDLVPRFDWKSNAGGIHDLYEAYLRDHRRPSLADSVRKTDSELKATAIFIVSYNRLECLRTLVSWLERHELTNIHILDNASTYGPLLDYLERLPHAVTRLPGNLGHLGLWKCGLFDDLVSSQYFILTDPDVIPVEECRADFLHVFYALLDRYPSIAKAGFGLRIDDIPSCYPLRDTVRRFERRYWRRGRPSPTLGCTLYDGYIDTTFALYRPGVRPLNDGTGRIERGWYKAIRTGFPYVARHTSWYLNPHALSEEEKFYAEHARERVSTWGLSLAEADVHDKLEM